MCRIVEVELDLVANGCGEGVGREDETRFADVNYMDRGGGWRGAGCSGHGGG